MKKIYEAEIIYIVNFVKRKFLGKEVEYEGEIIVPIPKYVLAFSEQNARDTIIYSDFWKCDFVSEIMWRDHKVSDFTVNRKYVRVEKVQDKSIDNLSKNMYKKDFLEWIFRDE